MEQNRNNAQIYVKKVKDILCIPHSHVHQNKNGLSQHVLKSWKWHITDLISGIGQGANYAVIILNSSVNIRQIFMKDFWNSATVRMTVDGGTIQWEKFVDQLPNDAKTLMKPPDMVTGDFDSLDNNRLQAYKMKGCKVIETPDQTYTDFTKALIELNKHCKEKKLEVNHVVAVGQFSGRIDHILGNIQTLFLAKEKCLLDNCTELYLMSDDSLSWLLGPGEHIIYVPEETRKHKSSWCSLIPVGEECKSITTSGLKWNMDESLRNNSMRFGSLVSTSNAFDGSDTVTVKCSEPVLWSMFMPMFTSDQGKC